MKYIDRLKADLRYEQMGGVHTYHQCCCGRMQCRSGACVLCLKERIAIEEEPCELVTTEFCPVCTKSVKLCGCIPGETDK